ncbi:hypothetical protein ACLOJK_001808 [Asimina triloba]
METALRHNRGPSLAVKQRRSGYEPSDTESEWQESPLHGLKKDNYWVSERELDAQHLKTTFGSTLNTTDPLVNHQRYSSMRGSDFHSSVKSSRTIPYPRSKSKSPYKTRGDDGLKGSRLQRNGSPIEVSEPRRHISPYEVREGEEDAVNIKLKGSYRKPKQRSPHKLMDTAETSRMNGGSNHHHRTLSAPRLRPWEKDQRGGSSISNGDRSPSPLAGTQIQKQKASTHARSPGSELNEMIANVKLSKNAVPDDLLMESTESIPGGDIFFSREVTALHKTMAPKNIAPRSSFPTLNNAASERHANTQQRSRGNNEVGQSVQVSSVSIIEDAGPSQQIARSSSAVSRQTRVTSFSSALSRGFSSKTSSGNSKMASGSRMQSQSFGRFVNSMERRQRDKWFSCVSGGACGNPKSPERKKIDEAAFIEKAFVVQNLAQFWADKHTPDSLNGFICHKPQAQLLKKLVSFHNCPHLLFRGPPGSGKKALSMALLSEIFGPSSCEISNDLRYFHIQEAQQMQVMVPVTSSPHHVEINLKDTSGNARYALMALIKEIASKYSPVPEFSDATLKADYKDDSDLLESIKSRCKVITLEAPVTHEIMEVLIRISKKENFDLPMSFAAKIATKSKQNLRNAIMALEACKAHNYPFIDDQPIPIGWEEVLVELAAEILFDPSQKRLAFARGKIQRLLVDFVHPKLILQLSCVEVVLVDFFVAKFMGIYRRSFSSSLHPEE